MISIEVIATYAESPQEIWTEEFPEEVSEAEALGQIFRSIQDDLDGVVKGANLRRLRKLSLCQLRSTAETCVTWLHHSNGKYYFA